MFLHLYSSPYLPPSPPPPPPSSTTSQNHSIALQDSSAKIIEENRVRISELLTTLEDERESHSDVRALCAQLEEKCQALRISVAEKDVMIQR